MNIVRCISNTEKNKSQNAPPFGFTKETETTVLRGIKKLDMIKSNNLLDILVSHTETKENSLPQFLHLQNGFRTSLKDLEGIAVENHGESFTDRKIIEVSNICSFTSAWVMLCFIEPITVLLTVKVFSRCKILKMEAL